MYVGNRTRQRPHISHGDSRYVTRSAAVAVGIAAVPLAITPIRTREEMLAEDSVISFACGLPGVPHPTLRQIPIPTGINCVGDIALNHPERWSDHRGRVLSSAWSHDCQKDLSCSSVLRFCDSFPVCHACLSS